MNGHSVPLVSYVAYYLPAALVGKVFGWWWACIAFVGALAFLVLIAADRQQSAAVSRLSEYKFPSPYRTDEH